MAKDKKKSRLKSFIQGEWFPVDAYKKYLVETVLVMALFAIFITFKFSVQVKLNEIISLRKELTDMRTNMIKVTSKYSSTTRESELTELVDTLKLGLKAPEQPAYNLDIKQPDK